MDYSIYSEAYLFGICILLGASLACFYDLFRIIRIMFCHANIVVDLEDLSFWLMTAVVVFKTLIQYNEGKFRAYAVLGMILGVILYELTISRLLFFIIGKLSPYWEKIKTILKKPFVLLKELSTKALKNIFLEVKMAIKGR